MEPSAGLAAALVAALAMSLLLGPRRPGLPRRASARALRGDGAPGPPAPDGGPSGGPAPGPRIALAGGAGAVALLLVPGAVGPVVAVLAAAVGWWRAGVLEPAVVRRRRERLEEELPHVVDLLLAVVGAGAAPGEALTRVGEVCHPTMRAELAVWVRRLQLGADPVQVWTGMAGHPQLGRLGRTLRRSAQSGAPVVEALEHLADDLRAHQRAEVETRVRGIEVRASVPLGVCLLPAFVLVGVVPLVVGAASGLLGGVG